MATQEVGGGHYLMAAAISDALRKDKGIVSRLVPSGTDVGCLELLRLGRAHFLVRGIGFYLAQEGVWDFTGFDWGPQPVRNIISCWADAGMLYGTAKDANIKTYADLKGKRVSWIIGYPAMNIIGDGMLAFAGLTWNDVKKVEFSGFGASTRGIVEGTVDAIGGATWTAVFYELETSPRGVYFPPLPHADKEGWARLMKVIPYMVKIKATVGAGGISESNPLDSGTYGNPNIVCYDSVNPELVYQFTKAVAETYKIYSASPVAGINGFALDKQVLDWVVPFHEGAIRYYKEVGKWTAEHQKHNDALIERQKFLMKIWDEAVAQAADQKVKDFPAFWTDFRVKKLEAAGMEVGLR